MKNFLRLFFIPLLWLNASAQELPYDFSVLNEAYADLEEPISLNQGSIWDDPSWEVSIGFDFVFMEQTFNALTWGGIDSYGGELLFGSSDGGPVWQHIMPYMQDLMDGGYDTEEASDSYVGYRVDGAPGSRIFKLEWKNCAFYNDDEASTMRINFQMWLYETTNDIEFRYGPSENLDDNVIQDYTGIVIGMSRDFDYINYTFTTLWAFTGDPQNPGIISVTDYTAFDEAVFLDTTPSSGTVYHFDTGIVSVEEENGIAARMYPTVVRDGLNVVWEGEGTAVLTITDLSGRIVDVRTLTGTWERVDVGALAPGWYNARLVTPDGHADHRFMK